MSKPDKDVDPHKPDATAGGAGQKDAVRPKGAARSWATVNKLPGGGKKIDARRNLPSGPLGGSGRKTNVSRSS